MQLYVCLDLGNDTVKISFTFDNRGMEVRGKLMSGDMVNQIALPAVASYDEYENIWRYADEMERVDKQNLSTVVKIKSMLSLVVANDDKNIETANKDFYYNGNFFPRFSFPVRKRMQSDFRYMVDQKLVFYAPGHTPRSMCLSFFGHIKAKVDEYIQRLANDTGIAFDPLTHVSIVYPPKQGIDYINELSYLVGTAFGVQPDKILTSTQALGLLAFHVGMLGDGERALFFDMGDETISVTKAWLNPVNTSSMNARLGILIDGAEGHSPPLAIGGSNIDESIAAYLDMRIHNRETVGSPSADCQGHIFEDGMCADQYLLMKDIKKTKMLMPLCGYGMFSSGVPISIHRETLVQRCVTLGDFYNCVGLSPQCPGVALAVLDYMLNELARPVNRDVTKVFIAGGMIETKGLFDYLRDGVIRSFPCITMLSFDSLSNGGAWYDIGHDEASTYAASLGGAIVSMRNYSVDAVLSYSYGTWLYHGNNKKHLKIFANRGDVLPYELNRFSINAAFDIDGDDLSSISGDEMFSTVLSTDELARHAYSDVLVYENDWLLIGDEGSDERRRAEGAIDLRVVAGGKGSEVWFYYRNKRVALYSRYPTDAYFEEGFIVDKMGRAVPFFENCRSKNNAKVYARDLSTNATDYVNLADIEFRLHMNNIKVSTNT